jgi:hypothetical protein
MRNDSIGNDPRTIWQNQPMEPSAMTLERIRQKVQELHAETRRQLLGSLIVPLLGRRLLRVRHNTVPRPNAATAIRVRNRMEPGRDVSPESRYVVSDDAGRRGIQHGSRVLPARGRAAAYVVSPRSAVVFRAGAYGQSAH